MIQNVFINICVDDGSTDNSAQIIREYANHNSNIRIISQSNKGAAAARQKFLWNYLACQNSMPKYYKNRVEI